MTFLFINNFSLNDKAKQKQDAVNRHLHNYFRHVAKQSMSYRYKEAAKEHDANCQHKIFDRSFKFVSLSLEHNAIVNSGSLTV